MREWTDVDYAQAAIDMLPESVEEIDAFMRAQGIQNPKVRTGPRSQVCPIAQWVRRWVGIDDVGAGYNSIRIADKGMVRYPIGLDDYIIYADRIESRV